MALALLENKKVILGSNSPRREELLKKLVKNFYKVSPTSDETLDETLEISKAVEKISLKKALSIKDECDVLITSDTLVFLENKALGKPKDKDEAFLMLKSLSGKTHSVITAVTIKTKSDIISFSECTQITFNPLSDEDILSYIATGDPFDKAGAYGLQSLDSGFVKSIDGDFYNVVGLPINTLQKYLERLD